MWSAIKDFFAGIWAAITAPAEIIKETKPTQPIYSGATPWVDVAKSQIGVKEIPGSAKNPQIALYHKAAAFDGTEDDSWCSSFMCWVFETAGLMSTNSPQARSWLNYGTKVDVPFVGCLVVFWRESKDSWKGHVGLYMGEEGDNILVLGGNQDNAVCIKKYPKSQLLGYRAPAQEPRLALSWGKPDWDRALTNLIKENLGVYDKADDITVLFPKWAYLNDAQKVKAVGEFWVALAYYESGFDPRSASVDVGLKDKKDTWSVGLFQMSVVDQQNLGIKFGFSYDDLITAVPNIKLAHAVMIRQITKYGKMLLGNSDKGRYWSVILIGNKFSKIEQIKARIKKHAPFV